jgi:hypothetical protein
MAMQSHGPRRAAFQQSGRSLHANALHNRNLNRVNQRQAIANRQAAGNRQAIANRQNDFRAARNGQLNQRVSNLQSQRGMNDRQQLRPNGSPRIAANAARNGRFASNFNNGNRTWHRGDRVFAHDAWRHHRHAAFVAWAGAIFFPFAYSDIFDYTFWPYAYDDGYWAYAYDDFIGSTFWGDASPYSDYAYYGPSPRSYTTGAAPSGSGRGPQSASVDPTPSGSGAPRHTAAAQACDDPGKGVTAWPFAQIEKAVRPNAEQQKLLDDVKQAAAEAAETFKASCAAQNFPLTPPGRLAAMTNRLEATLQAVGIVRPALEAFYNSLTDEQKARFTAIGPDVGADQARQARAGLQQDAKACGGEKQGLINLPMERVEDAVRPTEQQQSAFVQLREATSKAVDLLSQACPNEIPLTPVGRLEVMEQRLNAMVQAANTMQPALGDFYASLSNEQKARFNTLGQQAERNQ